MIKGGIGGANTNASGLKFEKNTDLETSFKHLKGYSVIGREVYFTGEKVAELYKKNDLYKYFLKKYNIDWKKIFSKRLFPDEAIFVLKHNTLYILEKKYQQGPGSTDEKIQTCDFKKKQYKKLLSAANIHIEYGYILNSWFNKNMYDDVFTYIKSVDCFYYFNELPFSFLGLPTPNN